MLKRIFISSAVAILISFSFPAKALAIYDPGSVDNNRFGMHVADMGDLTSVANLVNSNGGDWGYVTFVVQKGERDTSRWQKVMDQMRRLHLIPILRIASAPVGNNWEKLNPDEIDGWVSFLNSLNWVIKNRYVIVGNEPNHAKEWGREVDPQEYANYLKAISDKLKNTNSDFFVMPAGMDASATTNLSIRNVDQTMSEDLYLQKMLEAVSDVFNNIDGWASHSYPANFEGPATNSGKGSIGSFNWELEYLKSLGVKKELPVFITETGWTHTIDSLSTNIGSKYEDAFKNVWNDKRVVAVTPFIYKYTEPPFDNFSFINKQGEKYDFYDSFFNIAKTKGQPVQDSSGDILTGIMPRIAMANTNYHSVLFIKNTGQTIWDLKNIGAVEGINNRLSIESIYPKEIEPSQIGIFLLSGQFPNTSGSRSFIINLIMNNKIITNNFTTDVIMIPKIPNINDLLTNIKKRIF